ncbi:hypothetical protein C0Q70_08052 [Pomacea canaliculata]|uniref:Uncharacterized protein n=1 Tax=Pomacea canaliculata TaxID=400727 RepID=A0A2T7PGT7_POMCA|nr:hypothetical protein C0Q70_08052 [Pomacea canaliculata]
MAAIRMKAVYLFVRALQREISMSRKQGDIICGSTEVALRLPLSSFPLPLHVALVTNSALTSGDARLPTKHGTRRLAARNLFKMGEKGSMTLISNVSKWSIHRKEETRSRYSHRRPLECVVTEFELNLKTASRTVDTLDVCGSKAAARGDRGGPGARKCGGRKLSPTASNAILRTVLAERVVNLPRGRGVKAVGFNARLSRLAGRKMEGQSPGVITTLHPRANLPHPTR